MSQLLILHAHPRPRSSVVVHALGQVLQEQPNSRWVSLYERYPEFDIDVGHEQQALLEADTVVWLAPVYWYSVPGLLKHWFDTVLTFGWAYGHDAQGQATRALAGKRVWWVASAGGSADSYRPGGHHARPFGDFLAPVEQVARYCGMEWLEPFVAHGGHAQDPQQLQAQCNDLRLRAQKLCGGAQP